MIIADNSFSEMINAISREIRARVELYDGSTLLDTFAYNGALQSFVIERIRDTKHFFGHGIGQKCTVKLRDKERTIHVEKGQGIEIAFGVAENYLYTCPVFFVDDVQRDENTNELTIVAYDTLYQAANHQVSEIAIASPYTISSFANKCAEALGLSVQFFNTTNVVLNREYDTANYEGTENLREVFDDIAEATQTIYYIDAHWNLIFKRLDINGEAVAHIDKSKYFTLSTKAAHTLQNVMHVTELGDNVSATSGVEGETQFVRDNPWWELRDDVDDIVEEALEAVQGLTFVPFELKWRGNFLLEPCDKISITAKDNSIVYGYLLNESLTYNGGLVSTMSLEYATNASETASTPSTLFDTVKQTYAKVDKVNAQIELVVDTSEEHERQMALLQLNSDNISASVTNTNALLNEAVNGINQELDVLTNTVNAQITSEDVQIQISQALENGIDSVTTKTGYTFNNEGLTISKSGSEMETTITEDGMSVKRDNVEMLRADNQGVYGMNLHATTYLIVGGRSRFENYSYDRTGCFWVG